MARIIAEYKRTTAQGVPVTDEPLELALARWTADESVWGVCVAAGARWGGSIQDVVTARAYTHKPLLARVDIPHGIAHGHGADFEVTDDPRVAARWSAIAWLEVFSMQNLTEAETAGWPGIVIGSNRNPETGFLAEGNADLALRAVPKGTLTCVSGGYAPGAIPHERDFVILGRSLFEAPPAPPAPPAPAA